MGQDEEDSEPDLMGELSFDVATLLGLASVAEGRSQMSLRRAFVRAGLSLIEAWVATWRATALEEDQFNAAINGREPVLSHAERLALREKTIRLRSSGKVVEDEYFQDLIGGLKLALRSVDKVRGLGAYEEAASKLDVDAIRRARDVRNRLTHPKAIEDLRVTDAAVGSVKTAVDVVWGAIQIMNVLEIEYADGSKSSDPIDWAWLERHGAAGWRHDVSCSRKA